ncbi:MAG: cupin domain-containing protein [Gemmataceae bacterium]
MPADVLVPRHRDARAAGTAIFYFLTPDTFSALHRLPTDEVFHFYLGDPVEMLRLSLTPEDGGRIITPRSWVRPWHPASISPTTRQWIERY